MPFWGKLFSPLYLHYDGPGFESWLSGVPTARWVCAAVILALEIIYLLATFAFGVRFSNLTNRGILTNGPYRFTKHPAYIAKNMSWWMITLPFIPTHGWVEAVKWSCGLAGVSTIYFLRAKTEERHLSKDPAYVEYALWMRENGWLRFFDRVPLVRHAMYHPPVVVPAPVAAVTAVAEVVTVAVVVAADDAPEAAGRDDAAKEPEAADGDDGKE
jgi:protein-S-isoprenylcysteine O-methyltransferase Ste14